MSEYSNVGGGNTLDFGSSFAQGSLSGVGLASGNTINASGFGMESRWGMPGEYVPSTTLPHGPNAYSPPPPNVQTFQPEAPHEYAPVGQVPQSQGVISDVVIPMVEPTFPNFLDWIFSGG